MGLKAFWRKQSSWYQPSACGNLPEVGLSHCDQLSKTGRYHLKRLRKLLWLRYGRQFNSDTNPALHAMINYAADIRDQDIQRELLLLYLNCAPALQSILRQGGVEHPYQ